MCDQDHFEEDRQEAEARGLVTRRQFGALMGVGMAMMLPKVVNAVAVTEQDVARLRTAGFGDGEIAEIIAHVGLNVFTNYFNRAVHTEIDFPLVTTGQLV